VILVAKAAHMDLGIITTMLATLATRRAHGIVKAVNLQMRSPRGYKRPRRCCSSVVLALSRAQEDLEDVRAVPVSPSSTPVGEIGSVNPSHVYCGHRPSRHPMI
jgi:hypothetical protein